MGDTLALPTMRRSCDTSPSKHAARDRELEGRTHVGVKHKMGRMAVYGKTVPAGEEQEAEMRMRCLSSRRDCRQENRAGLHGLARGAQKACTYAVMQSHENGDPDAI